MARKRQSARIYVARYPDLPGSVRVSIPIIDADNAYSKTPKRVRAGQYLSQYKSQTFICIKVKKAFQKKLKKTIGWIDWQKLKLEPLPYPIFREKRKITTLLPEGEPEECVCLCSCSECDGINTHCTNQVDGCHM